MRSARSYPAAFLVLAVLSLLASCGGGDGGGGRATPACTPNGNIWLLNSVGDPLLATSVTTSQGVSVPAVQVFVGYTSQAAVIEAGYSPGAVDPRTVGMDIIPIGGPAANPARFDLTFDAGRPIGTYAATWRFVARDAGYSILGCQDLPVTFTVN